MIVIKQYFKTVDMPVKSVILDGKYAIIGNEDGKIAGIVS